MKKISSAREAAYFTLLEGEDALLENMLSNNVASLSLLDKRLAKEITFGVVRRKRTLEAVLQRVHGSLTKLTLKRRVKILLLMAYYQYLFMERIPDYALVNESVDFAKKEIGVHESRFVNALLRKLTQKPASEWLEEIKGDLGKYYSFTDLYVAKLTEEYGEAVAKEILEIENKIFPPHVRQRLEVAPEALKDLTPVYQGEKFPVFQLEKEASIEALSRSKEWYIQNSTPVFLMEELSEVSESPTTILDLCASPGGKLLLAHDLFPSASLVANDVSEAKMAKVKENLDKYNVRAEYTIGKAEEFPSGKKYDLVIADVPCSNSGVFHKRAEARWRFEKENLLPLVQLQKEILSKAYELLSPGGQIWYLTCSIVKEENEDLVATFARDKHLEIVKMCKVLPNLQGSDGGFGAVLRPLADV